MSVANSPEIRYFMKSRFRHAVECPTKLMHTGRNEYVDTNSNNEMLQGLAEGGLQIGALAQAIYAKEAMRECALRGNQG